MSYKLVLEGCESVDVARSRAVGVAIASTAGDVHTQVSPCERQRDTNVAIDRQARPKIRNVASDDAQSTACFRSDSTREGGGPFVQYCIV